LNIIKSILVKPCFKIYKCNFCLKMESQAFVNGAENGLVGRKHGSGDLLSGSQKEDLNGQASNDRVGRHTESLFDAQNLMRGGPYLRNERLSEHTLSEIQEAVEELTSQADNRRRPKVLPDHFDGKKDWRQYLAHFDTVASLNGWSARERAQYLSVSLRGEACVILQSLNPEEKCVYFLLCEAIERRLNPGNKVNLYRSQLRSRIRKEKESLPQLAQSIRMLAAQAYPNADRELFESLCCDHFLDAVGDSDIRTMLSLTQNQKFDDLIGMAVQIEANKTVERQRNPRRFVREVQQVVLEEENAFCNEVYRGNKTGNTEIQLKSLQEMLESLKKELNEMKKGNIKNRDWSQVECYHCHEKGHVKTRCSRLQNSGVKANQSN
jgi:hypothetical protein